MKTVNGTYGQSKNKCKVFEHRGWYCSQGSVNVNRTRDEIEEGVDIEELNDYDTFTADKPINTEKQLVKAIES